MVELRPENVFKLHPRIRWTAFAKNSEVVFSLMRPGVESRTSDEVDKAIMEGVSLMLQSGLFAQSMASHKIGRVESVIINFEKLSVLWTFFKNGQLGISVHRAYAYSVFQEVSASLKRLSIESTR